MAQHQLVSGSLWLLKMMEGEVKGVGVGERGSEGVGWVQASRVVGGWC